MLSLGGPMDYVISGMEKDPEIPWNDVLIDMDAFFRSELMNQYKEGSFWKDLYYLLDFLSTAID